MLDEIIEPLLTTAWGRRASWGAAIGMALLLAIVLVEILAGWYGDIGVVLGSHVGMKSSISLDETAQRIAKLPDQHLFGQSRILSNADLPITSLQLHLVGVIKAEPEEFSRVIISEAGQPSKVYRVGDVLSSGVKIHGITQDGVVLENGGRLEKLPLQRPPLLFQGMPKRLLHDENTQEE